MTMTEGNTWKTALSVVVVVNLLLTRVARETGTLKDAAVEQEVTALEMLIVLRNKLTAYPVSYILGDV